MEMFGYVTADLRRLTPEQRTRYNSVYCGICRRIREQASGLSRMTLSYDMAFLALILMSLYEPEEQQGKRACNLHPICPRPWVDNEYIRYAADMNVALAYYKALDDWQDDGSTVAKWLAGRLESHQAAIGEKYPRQCKAIAECIDRLSQLERENCANPDEPANCFGQLMAQLLVYREDLWAPTLETVGRQLGRFIYLADAAQDYRRDVKKGKYNPYIAMNTGEDREKWEEYLVLTMGKCTKAFEKLPLVQDKGLLDNILYSGVWCALGGGKKQKEEDRNGSV